MPSIRTINYAVPPTNYFWHWSSDGHAIEWWDDSTISLREEILTILSNLSEHGGIPPIGSLLLILASCNQQEEKAIAGFLHVFAENSQASVSSDTETFLSAIKNSLIIISQLPKELRYGLRAKTKLCQALFARTETSHRTEIAQNILFELQAASPSSLLEASSNATSIQRLLRDGKTILKSCAELTTEKLQHLIETGLEFEHLSAAEISNPLHPAENDNRPLLDLLESESHELKGIASLARKVIGLISVPRPAKRDEELRIGGVSDIINRGTPDRLLISELAWDDLALATRLAHNEALYYRRETPPENAPAERIILMDHGLRYWGLLRLYAHAAVLGLKTHSNDHANLTTRSFITHKERHQEITLESVHDVKTALTRLPTHIDPSPALLSLHQNLLENPPNGIPDLFFITTIESISGIETKNTINTLATLIRKYGGHCYLILISQNGDLLFEEHLGAQTKLLQKGRLDLNEILPQTTKTLNRDTPKKASETLNKTDLEEVTATSFYNHYPPPLLFHARPKIIHNCIEDKETSSFIGVNTERKIMRWFHSDKPAEELSHPLPGREHWVHMEDGKLLVACSGTKAGDSVQVLKINNDGCYEALPTCSSRHPFPIRVLFTHHNLLIIYTDNVEAISIDTGKRVSSLTRQGENISNKLIWMDGDDIVISKDQNPKPTAYDFFKESNFKNEFQENLKHPIRPSQIAIKNDGKIVLLSKEKNVIFDDESMCWIPLKSISNLQYLAKGYFKQLDKKDSLQHTLSQVKLGSLIATHDHRGILHLNNQKKSWSFGLYEGDVSSWNEACGVVSPVGHWHKNGVRSKQHEQNQLFLFLNSLTSTSFFQI